MRRSTASDTAIKKKDRWLRLGHVKSELPEFDQLLNLYWGGPERRITGLTLRIIAVNAVALIMLMAGTLYLGQYQRNLIEAKLETFKTEINLVSAAISEGAGAISGPENEHIELDLEQAQTMVRRLKTVMAQRIRLFDRKGQKILDSSELTNINRPEIQSPEDKTFYTIRILKKMTGFIIKLLPDHKTLPVYPDPVSNDIRDYPDAHGAIAGHISMSAWNNTEDHIFLSAAAPLYKNGQVMGVILLTRDGRDIEEDIGNVWINILQAFAVTLVLTILLSIYLSGVIARPLRRLATAAEGVRKGQLKYSDIPDLGSRHDEIGELSIAFRQMTEALWDRMDLIERFAADVSHELKNPLTSLRSAVETASVVKKKTDRDKLMDIIKHDIERLDRLITDISHASRLDSELSREAFERVSLIRVLKNILNAYKGPLERKEKTGKNWNDSAKTGQGVEIKLNSSIDEDITVWGLTGRLEQVFQNILANALSFSPENGVITIQVTPQSKKQVQVTIEDQGPGIPEAKLETIFDRFYSQRPEHEAYGKHSGLGLSICQQIMTALSGKIYAENIKNNAGKISGARFTVILNRA